MIRRSPDLLIQRAQRAANSAGRRARGVRTSRLRTRGDTSPNSALAVDRFSTAPHGKLVYKRYSIKVDARTAAAVRAGQAVLVVHGLDYNQNGKYDFAGAGASELNAKVPAEATDPAACGVLHRH